MSRFTFSRAARIIALGMTVVPIVTTLITTSKQALADTPVAASAPVATVVLPLDRTRYFAGETILVSATDTGTSHKLSLQSDDGKMVSGQSVAGRIWSIDTTKLPVGPYQIVLDGVASGTRVEIVSPIRRSPAAISDEILPNPTTDAARSELRKTLTDTGINALMGVNEYGVGAPGTYGTGAADDYAATNTMYWLNPYTRPMSFYGARVYAPEVRQFRQRLAQIAQLNDRFPTFGGFQYEWDPGSFFDRSGLLIFWAWGDQESALRTYLKKSTDAIYADFTNRTGLTAPTTAEYISFLASVGHPEFGPAIDYPEYRWLNAIAKNTQAMTATEQADYVKRQSAWTEYLSNIYNETYTGHQEELKRIDPSLANTASIDTQTTVREGHWQERAYAPLDFRFIEAWDDQTSVPNSPYQWLLMAALADMGRKQTEPVWVASSLGTVYDQALYPGKFMRVAADDLAYGGRGIGFALEGFSTVLGGMNAGTAWSNIKGKAGAADLNSGCEFLDRFAPLQAQCTDVRNVGVLLSLTQYSQQQTPAGLFTPQGRIFLALARLGYTPRFISEEDIVQRHTQGLHDLVIVNQSAALPDAVMKGLASLQTAGLRVIVDQASTVSIPGSVPMAVRLPFKYPGKPFNWPVVNVEPNYPQNVVDQVNSQIMPAVLAALGDNNRSALVSTAGASTKTAAYSLSGGPDAQYVVVVDDALGTNPSAWRRLTETLTPNHTAGTLYDVTDEKEIGPIAAGIKIPCEFNTVSARMFAILSRPIASVRLSATQTVDTDDMVSARVEIDGDDAQLIPAATPLSISIVGPGGTRQQFDRATSATGIFEGSFPLVSGASAGTYRIEAHCRLNGLTVSLPVTVHPASAPIPAVDNDTVFVRGDRAIAAFLHDNPRVAVPVFESPSKAALLNAANQLHNLLAARGVTAEVLAAPAQTTYTMAYDPSPAEAAENLRAEQGESIGKIQVTTLDGYDYFATESGYVYGRPLILLDLVTSTPGTGSNGNAATTPANPMASAISRMLWPHVSASFPGPGKAVIQLVRSAFNLGDDTVVIQATDTAGLTAGINALTNLPSDKITTGVEHARETMLQQLSVGTIDATQRPIAKLTKIGLSAPSYSPQPLAIDFTGCPVPPDSATAPVWEAPKPNVHPLPATVAVADMVPYYQPGDTLIQAWNPGGQFIGDLRFLDADGLTVDAGAGGTMNVSVDGQFRYSDRIPKSQSIWEEVIALYEKVVPQTRRPITADVYIDGKLAGSLTLTRTGDIDAVVDTPGGSGYAHLKPKTVHEEAVTRISGTVTLPAGVHTLMVRPLNVVDGQVTQITVAP